MYCHCILIPSGDVLPPNTTAPYSIVCVGQVSEKSKKFHINPFPAIWKFKFKSTSFWGLSHGIYKFHKLCVTSNYKGCVIVCEKGSGTGHLPSGDTYASERVNCVHEHTSLMCCSSQGQKLEQQQRCVSFFFHLISRHLQQGLGNISSIAVYL